MFCIVWAFSINSLAENSINFTKNKLENIKLTINTETDPNHIFDLLMQASDNNVPLLLSQGQGAELIEFAIEKGADLDKLLKNLYGITKGASALGSPINNEQLIQIINSAITKGANLDKILENLRKLIFFGFNLEQATRLITHVIKNCGSPSSIDPYYINHISDEDLSNLWQNNALTPQLLLFLATHLIDGIPEPCSKNVAKLINTAVTNGANFDDFPQNNHEYASQHTITNRNQYFLQQQLALIAQKLKLNPDITSRIQQYPCCYALTTLWLYSKWLQFNQPEKTGGYDNKYDKDWFNKIINLVSNWKKGSSINTENAANFKKFAELIDFFQSPQKFVEGLRAVDTNIHQFDNRLTLDGKILRENYKIACSFDSPEQLANLLKEIVHDNNFIYIVKSAHFMGLFKHENEYYLYEPKEYFGECKYKTIDAVAAAIFDKTNKAGLIICDFQKNTFEHPEHREVLEKIYTKNNMPVDIAILIRSAESLRFFLDHGLSPTAKIQYQGKEITLLGAATLANSPDIVAILLKEPGVDPRQLLDDGPDSETRAVKNMTCLHIAAKKGFFEVVKVILNDPRTVINQKDSNNKTALDYAISKNHSKTIKILKLH